MGLEVLYGLQCARVGTGALIRIGLWMAMNAILVWHLGSALQQD
jgi:hypothetical protein